MNRLVSYGADEEAEASSEEDQDEEPQEPQPDEIRETDSPVAFEVNSLS